jgi:hypothetical protein
MPAQNAFGFDQEHGLPPRSGHRRERHHDRAVVLHKPRAFELTPFDSTTTNRLCRAATSAVATAFIRTSRSPRKPHPLADRGKLNSSILGQVQPG